MTTSDPSISVIIPVYNDPIGVENTLESLVSQTMSSETYEVLPVDNGSSDGTVHVIRQFAEAHPDLITPLRELDVQSSYAARNRGIEEARGTVFAFVDADMTVGEGYLEEVATEFENGAEYLACDVTVYVPDGEDTIWARFDAALGLPVHHHLSESQFAPTCCLSVHRSVVERVGPFDARLVSGGDKEFGHRVADAGIDMRFAGDITMYHPARTTLRSLLKKAQRIGRGQVQFQRYHSDGYPPVRLLHPINYAPPSIGRLLDRCSLDEDPPIATLCAFFAIDYVLKMGRYKGKILEAW